MAIEDTFNGAKNAFTLFFAYLNTVAQEIGMERALALNTKMWEAMGAARGKMMKEQSDIKEFDARAAHSLTKSVPENIGISMEVLEESPQRVVTKTGKCPLYEACQVVGLDAKTIEARCRTGSVRFMDAAVKQLNPNLNYRLRKHRSGPDDFCEEEIVLS